MTSSERLRRYWDKQSAGYDRQMGFLDRRLFADTRPWICSRATGRVLEVAIGTGLNLPHYPANVELIGVEFSPRMLEHARRRAEELGRRVDLRVGDAQALEFDDETFDTVVCTFSLCAISDYHRAIDEMLRVLRPGGRLLLADHVEAASRPARAAQWLLERVTIPLGGEHFRRRPLRYLQTCEVAIEDHDRFRHGIVERLVARKSGPSATS